ncbi:MAG: hypothetical protein KJZ80_06115 [Hyphomicrobiaceae bacterium]|nr:hypothetical protein [Hyphomicrobiaceae bacterium]
MILAARPKSATAYLLADHLDAVLAAGEDLLRVHRVVASEVPVAARRSLVWQVSWQRRTIDAIRTLEMTLAMRGLRARERAEELRRADPRVGAIAGLFIGGTAALADAAGELGDWTEFDFQTGNEVVAYLRSRGLVAPDSAGPGSLDELAVTARFRIGGHVELVPLLDLAATFLDALEISYELYDNVLEDAGPSAGTSEIVLFPEPAI